jgi:chemotaxis signal transduction protein
MPLSVSITRDDVQEDAFVIQLKDESVASVSFLATEEELGLMVDEILEVMGLPAEQTAPTPWTVL